jgi:hypothetical protein
LHLEFTYIFATNFVGSLDIRASREVFPIGVRRPEIGLPGLLVNSIHKGLMEVARLNG